MTCTVSGGFSATSVSSRRSAQPRTSSACPKLVARTVGNQRRILSEDLGVGFATLLSRSWQLPGVGAGPVSVKLADVDMVLAYRLRGHGVKPVGGRRPDYLVIMQGAGSATTIGLLECKGTRVRNYGHQQLATASEQLAGLLVDGGRVPGLAISTEVADDAIRYRAVQRLPHPELYDRGGGEDESFLAAPAVPAAGLTVTEEVPVFSSLWDEAFQANLSAGGATALVTPALAASWASLADLSGNEEALDRWRPSDAYERQMRGLPARRRAPRPRGIYRGPDGRPVRGVANVLGLPGGRLEVVLGALVEVDDALTSGDSATILRTQAQAVAERLRRAENRVEFAVDVETGDDVDGEVAAYGSDGSALLLRPLGD